MKTYNVKRGYTIPLKGNPEPVLENTRPASFYGVCPDDFTGIRPGLGVSEGDSVKKGTILFYDKNHPAIRIVSPVSGKVHSVVYGPRRKIEAVVIAPGEGGAVKFKSHSAAEIGSLERSDLIETLLKSGVWPFLRQRPFSTIANPEDTPSSLFINAMDTAPLAHDTAFALEEDKEFFYAGAKACKVLANGPVHLTVNPANADSWLKDTPDVTIHTFKGKHPAGLVGTHIAHIDPLVPGKKIWYINASLVAALGKFLLTGEYPAERTIATSGSGLKEHKYYKTITGARIPDLLGEKLKSGKQRLISGNILTGTHVDSETGYLGFYDDQITVIPEGGEQKFLGWLMPGFNRHSFTNTFASALTPGRKYELDSDLNGELRTFVMTGNYRKVVALDIHPDLLAKAIITEDIDMMEKLGILEVDPEDVALCSYICPSKIEFTDIYKKGLELYRKETHG